VQFLIEYMTRLPDLLKLPERALLTSLISVRAEDFAL
jgi:hypothetical protein